MTTQFAKASYQEIIDLHTESDKVSVIGIHTPTSDTPRKMFGGFFDQFKKFKYLGCSISLVPAARLPADPLQVSYEAGEQTIDPRDMLNPLMFHGCHGNDMGVILNRLYALNSIDAKKMDSVFQYEVSTDGNYDIAGFQLEDLYYKALTDNTWKKAHPQRGFRKSGLRPLVYSVATNHQLLGASAVKVGNSGNLNMDPIQGLPLEMDYELGGTSGSETMDIYSNTTAADLRFFTPRLTGLGWLDTRNAITQNVLAEGVALTTGLSEVEAAVSQLTAEQQSEPDLPLVYMGMILLPPAYKTEQYFRMIVNHHFAFKEFRGISFSNTMIDTPAYANFNDDDWTQGGDSVNPDDPGSGGGSGGGDEPGDGPLAGANILFNLTDSGTIQFDSKIFDTMGTFEYEGVDYQPVDYRSSYKRGFLIQQSDRLGEVSTPKIGVVYVFTTPISEGHIGIDRITDVSNVAKWNGEWWAYGTIGGNTKWYHNVRFTTSNVEATTDLSPENSGLSSQLGSTTAFSDITYGS